MDFRTFIFNESKQELEKIGIPKVVASLFYNKFGKNGTLVGKWYKDYYSFLVRERYDWFRRKFEDFSSVDLYDMILLYEAKTKEEYIDIAKKKDIAINFDYWSLEEQKIGWKKEIEKLFMRDIFFLHTLIKEILSGALTDVAPYKELRFDQAQDKYDKKNLFQDKTPIKTYVNGWRWIDVGRRCTLLAKKMKNCGSVGLMSQDEHATMLALFDKGNKPHVMITYSPSENMLAQEQGIASTAIKDKYTPYIMDLARTIKANFDPMKSKSPTMQIQYRLESKGFQIKKLWQDTFSSGFLLTAPDGKEYFSNSYVVISKSDVEKLARDPEITQKDLWNKRLRGNNISKNVFHTYLRDIAVRKGAKYETLWQFAERFANLA